MTCEYWDFFTAMLFVGLLLFWTVVNFAVFAYMLWERWRRHHVFRRLLRETASAGGDVR